MITIVTIAGLGGTINYETIIIRRALEAAGIIVEVEDDYPFNKREPDLTEDEYLDRIKDRRENWPFDNLEQPLYKVKLITEHCPVGG
jgi:hypothetical protein